MDKELTMRERVELKCRIDDLLDQYYERASELGVALSKFAKRHQSQLRNLETVVAAATRTSSLKNHIKNQTGKDRLIRNEGARTWASGAPCLGERVLTLLEELPKSAAEIVGKTTPAGSVVDKDELARLVEIELQRGIVHTTVCAAIFGNSEAQP